MGLTTTISLDIVAKLTKTLDLVQAQPLITRVERALSWADGGDANQASKVWGDTRQLLASATEDLDLAGAALLSPFGDAVVFAGVKLLYVRAHPTNVNTLVIGGAPANAWVGPFADATDKISLPPGGEWLILAPTATGYVVTPGTGDLLRIANGGAGSAVNYDIVVIGN